MLQIHTGLNHKYVYNGLVYPIMLEIYCHIYHFFCLFFTQCLLQSRRHIMLNEYLLTPLLRETSKKNWILSSVSRNELNTKQIDSSMYIGSVIFWWQGMKWQITLGYTKRESGRLEANWLYPNLDIDLIMQSVYI